MIDKLINKYGTILNTLRENKSTKSDTDLYDYNNDIKNTREYLKDLKALKKTINYTRCYVPFRISRLVNG